MSALPQMWLQGLLHTLLPNTLLPVGSGEQGVPVWEGDRLAEAPCSPGCGGGYGARPLTWASDWSVGGF